MTYLSTKTYGHDLGLSVCFRQWRAKDSHCRFLHGYALRVHLEFEAEELDDRNWVIDFGGLKGFKAWLEAMFDHKMLIAEDDPQRSILVHLTDYDLADAVIVPATGCEAMAELVFAKAQAWLEDNGHFPRVSMRSVEVCEHGANSAIYELKVTP